MGPIRDISEKAWKGKIAHPGMSLSRFEVMEKGLAVILSFANVVAIETEVGLVLIDTGGFRFRDRVHRVIRKWTELPLHTAIHTHGHIDHTFGVQLFEKEVGAPTASVIAHENLALRIDRYKRTNGYNNHINNRQFQMKQPSFPIDNRYPDVTYQHNMQINVGGVHFELNHAKGETDDHTWVWIPKYKALAVGDFFIWNAPNCGNPQKVQRYPMEWAQALREMMKKDANYLLPGHGPPIIGYDRIQRALGDMAEYLESIVSQTMDLMNKGYPLDSIVHLVKPPTELCKRPYLHATYDEPEFIVRNIWRLYGGWWGGNPSKLKPSPEARFSREVSSLCNGVMPLVHRASQLIDGDDEDRRVACELIDLASAAEPENTEVHKFRAKIYNARKRLESSLMSKGIFNAAEQESKKILKRKLPKKDVKSKL